MKGMDVETIEGLAKQLDAKAASATSIVAASGRLVRGAEKLWLGRRADRWLTDWLNEEAALRRTAQFVRDMAQKLREEAAQQSRASGGFSGGAPAHPTAEFLNPSPSAAPSSDQPDWLRQGNENLASINAWLDGHLVTAATGFTAVLGAVTGTARGTEYGKVYRHLIGNDFFRYNRSLHKTYSPTITKILGSPLMTGVDRIGKGFAVVDSTANVYDTFTDSRSTGGERVEAGGLAVGSALKMSKNPVTYLAGAGVSAWSMVYNEASKIDTSYVSETFAYAAKNKGEVLASLGDAVKDMATNKIWKIFG
jgi:uncharacterized protein YukE